MKHSFFNLDYNHKIDYYIVKKLIPYFPLKCGEFELRRAYIKNKSKSNDELKLIIKIKKYLNKHKLNSFTVDNYQRLIKLITNDSFEYSYKIPFEEMNLDSLYEYISFVRCLGNDNIKYTAVAIMVLYVHAKADKIIIPYRSEINELLNNSSYEKCHLILESLVEKTLANNIKHDIRLNKEFKDYLIENRKAILQEFKEVKSYGLFGSLAMDKGNEYSNADLLVISDSKGDSLKNELVSYFKQITPITVDVVIVTEDDIDMILNECIKNTLVMINGGDNEKLY